MAEVPRCSDGATFRKSTWEWDEDTQEYYLHYFCPGEGDRVEAIKSRAKSAPHCRRATGPELGGKLNAQMILN